MDKLADLVLWLAVTVIGWLVKSKFDTDKQIADLRTVVATNSQEIEDHKIIDTERFERIEIMFAEMRRNHLDMMRALNGNRARS